MRWIVAWQAGAGGVPPWCPDGVPWCPVVSRGVPSVSRRCPVGVPSVRCRRLVVSRGEIDCEIDSETDCEIDSHIDCESIESDR